MSQIATPPYVCRICNKSLPTPQGLKSHHTRLHKTLPFIDSTIPLHAATQSDTQTTTCKSLAGTSTPPSFNDQSFAEQLGSWRSTTRIIRRIPKGARHVTAEALAQAIEICLAERTPHSWIRLLSFAAICLSTSPPTTTPAPSLTNLVKKNIRDYQDGKSLPEPPSSTRPRQTRSLSMDQLARAAQAKLADGDVKGAIRLLTSDSCFATETPETLEALRSKHPPAFGETSPPPDVVSPPQVSPLSVSESAVSAAIASFPAGSAGGLDLLRPQHLKDLISKSSGMGGARLLTAITRLCNLMLEGSIPDFICPILYGATLCAFLKPSGDLRPIAIGCTFRRLVSKLGSAHISTRLGDKLRPTQLGFGTQGGLEAATHAVRRYLAFDHPSPKAILKVDFSNAYNRVRRSSLLQAVHDHLPELYPYVRQNYHHPSHLMFGETHLRSERGIQQGDPLGPALFCLLSHPMASQLNSELNVWYQDDGTLADSPETVLQDFVHIIDLSSEIGLELNFAKCELIITGASPTQQAEILQSFRRIAPDIQLTDIRNCTQLGAPILQESAANSIAAKTATLHSMSQRLSHLPAHCALYLLKNSQALPKLTHLLRCSLAWRCDNQLQQFDSTLLEAVQTVLNINFTDEAWQQASWPIALGGLGMRHASDLALPAFLASYYSTSQLVSSILPPYITAVEDTALQSCLTKWTVSTGASPPHPDKRRSQPEWERPTLETSRRHALEHAPNLPFKARLLSVASITSGAFLQVRPASNLGTQLQDNEVRIAVALRLGLDLCTPHTCVCGAPVQSSGTHGLSCRQSTGRFSRHASVNDILKRALSSAEIPATLEPAHLSLDSNIRPDGVSLVPWERGLPVAWDFTCADSTAPSYLAHTSEEPLYAATLAERQKTNKYASMVNSHIFVPIAAECLGSIGHIGLTFLQALGRRIQLVTGERRSTEFLLQRISLAIQRGNAKSIQGTLPKDASLDEDLAYL